MKRLIDEMLNSVDNEKMKEQNVRKEVVFIEFYLWSIKKY
jgi:hypothetical protein